MMDDDEREHAAGVMRYMNDRLQHLVGERGPELEVGPVDTPPASGEFADWDGAQHDPELVAEGNRLGETIDPDDDTDNGGF